MDDFSLTVYGEPQALKRHRHRNMGKFVQTYDPSKEDKENFLYKAITDNKPSKPIEKPIILHINFYMSRPKSHYGTGKNSNKLKPSAPKYHIKKPDLDNLVKFVKDAFNGVYWKDDSQIFKMYPEKHYTNFTPRTEITLEIIDK